MIYITNQLSNIVRLAKEKVTKASTIGMNTIKWRGMIEYLDFSIAVMQGASDLFERFQVNYLMILLLVN